jgi:hypothetical protein
MKKKKTFIKLLNTLYARVKDDVTNNIKDGYL